MKTVKEEKEIVKKEIVTSYIAEDGTKFASEEECKEYEGSAKFAVKVRLMDRTLFYVPTGWKDKGKLPCFYFGFETIFPCCDDFDFYMFAPESEEDIKNFILWTKLEGISISEDYHYSLKGRDDAFKATFEEGTDFDRDYDEFRSFSTLNELTPGKTYIYRCYDDYGRIVDVEAYRKTVDNILKGCEDWLDNKKKSVTK